MTTMEINTQVKYARFTDMETESIEESNKGEQITHTNRSDSENPTITNKFWSRCINWAGGLFEKNQRRSTILIIILIALLLIFGIVTLSSVSRNQRDPGMSPASVNVKKVNTNTKVMAQALTSVLGSQNGKNTFGLSVGMRNDYLLQECQKSGLKHSFPDIDYAFLGYNILRGNPLSVGHDPGLTQPIFTADYSEGKQTADCRYSIPKGILVIPDVSCVTSFSSRIAQSEYEFAEELSVGAKINGGGWGLSFSASAGYKEAKSQLATGESVFIISKAECNYYYVKLLEEISPKFHPVFKKWIVKLSKENPQDSQSGKNTYMAFFEKFGTHYIKEVKFGATFTYKYEMSSKKYAAATENNVNVAVEAGYSGAFSVGGGFHFDSSQKQRTQQFQKNVTTTTIARGAPPPADGDYLKWASTVKQSPVPVSYQQLQSIEELFSDKFFTNNDMKNIDYKKIFDRIKLVKAEYCLQLQRQGDVDNCAQLNPGIKLKNTRLIYRGGYRKLETISSERKQATTNFECINECMRTLKCVGVTFCVTCPKDHKENKQCYLQNESKNSGNHRAAIADETWETNILQPLLYTGFKLVDTELKGEVRDVPWEKGNITDCLRNCIDDMYCVAFTFYKGGHLRKSCNMFSGDGLSSSLKPGATTYFISQRLKATGSTSGWMKDFEFFQ